MKSRSDFLAYDEQDWNDYLLFYYSGQVLKAMLSNPFYAQIMGENVKEQDLARVTSLVAIEQAQALIDELKKTLQENYQARLKK